MSEITFSQDLAIYYMKIKNRPERIDSNRPKESTQNGDFLKIMRLNRNYLIVIEKSVYFQWNL